MRQRGFFPDEIIFSPTAECNLHCPHCFVGRKSLRLFVDDAICFLQGCKESSVRKIGFSGGEPFLYPEFLNAVSEFGVKNDFLFDRIITNGIWWKDERQLKTVLKALYDSGFDGKIAVSFDSFHSQGAVTQKDDERGLVFKSQYKEKVLVFIQHVIELWGGQGVELQSVLSFKKDFSFGTCADGMEFFCDSLLCKMEKYTKKDGTGVIFIKNDQIFIPVYIQNQVFPCDNALAWKSKKWFREDYCQGPGNVLFVHPNGNIAPCCGFANEREELKIGTIKQPAELVLQQAKENAMVRLCYEDGLSSKIKQWKKITKSTFKTSEICTFCDEICAHSAELFPKGNKKAYTE